MEDLEIEERIKAEATSFHATEKLFKTLCKQIVLFLIYETIVNWVLLRKRVEIEGEVWGKRKGERYREWLE